MTVKHPENVAAFLDPVRLRANGPRAFTSAIERLLQHLGFDDIRNIDGSGDKGGDILARFKSMRWVFQSKWTSGATINEEAVLQVDTAKAFYSTDRAVVATNARPSAHALKRRNKLASVGVRIDMWDEKVLAKFASGLADELPRFPLRPYQQAATDAAWAALKSENRALVVLATGLGKTVVGGDIIARHLAENPGARVLVTAHTRELVSQLEKAMWRWVDKSVPTQVLTGQDKPASLDGITCATIESALAAVKGGYQPDFVMVDEAHHVSAEGSFQQLLDALQDIPQLGVTATPWRGDGYDLTHRFGAPVFTMGIAEGMSQGFLSQVRYRLFTDGLDWEAVADASERGLSIRDLNHRLFLPQRDEQVVDELRSVWDRTKSPRAILFCRTIDHAEEIAKLLRASGWRRAAALSNRQNKRERNILLSEFRDGRIPIITTVDLLNEGVDVPDVNIICFLRVTHSRRIFVQQLGRGLRLSAGKEYVQVLDFVSDIRRIAATLDLRRALDRLPDSEIERLSLPHSAIEFSEPDVGTLMEEWIEDAAALEDADEEIRLQFPEVPWA